MAAGAISQQPVATALERTIVVADPPPLPLRYYSRRTVLDAIAAAPIALPLFCAEPLEPAKRRLRRDIVRIAMPIGVGSTYVGVTRRRWRPGYP
jgi:hypothetical protein